MDRTAANSRRFTVTAIGFALIALAPACSKKSAARRPSAVAAPRPVASTIQEPAAVAHGTRKQMNLDVPVYVDGVAMGVLRAGDLPEMPEAHAWNGTKGFRLYDYLKGIGVATDGIRAVHLYNNNSRIGGVEGTELRADKNRFVVSFSSGETGTPTSRWHTDGLKNEFVPHEIRRVAVYVTKAPPAVDPGTQCIIGKAGPCGDEVPYAEKEMAKGTRIYSDGKIVGFVKRRMLTDAMVVGGKDETDRQFSVSKFLTSLGIDLRGSKGIELMAGDDVVARADGKRWEGLRDSLYFTIPPHSHGKVRAHVPAEMQGSEKGTADKDGLITAVRVYKSSNISTREIYPISDETDMSVQVARTDDEPQTN